MSTIDVYNQFRDLSLAEFKRSFARVPHPERDVNGMRIRSREVAIFKAGGYGVRGEISATEYYQGERRVGGEVSMIYDRAHHFIHVWQINDAVEIIDRHESISPESEAKTISVFDVRYFTELAKRIADSGPGEFRALAALGVGMSMVTFLRPKVSRID